MRVVMTGSAGMIGTALRRSYQHDGHTVLRLVRREPRSSDEIFFDPFGKVDPAAVEGADVVINLAGAGIGEHRWTKTYRRIIHESRITAARALSAMVVQANSRPKVFLCASGIRYYGNDRGEEILTESSVPIGEGFLPTVARAWEAATRPASDAGIPVCQLRMGIVMSRYGGALPRILPFFRAGLGARFASGRQFWSYICLADTVDAIRFLAVHPNAHGPYNITAPEPVRNAEFTQALARVLGKPARLWVPGWALRIALGGISVDALGGLRVVPTRLMDAGFRHRHPDLDSALRSAVS